MHIPADDDPQTQLGLEALLDRLDPAAHLYICGPKGMIAATVTLAHARQWPQAPIHVELFTKAAAQSGDRGFDVELRQSGLTFHIPPDTTLLDVLAEAGCAPLYTRSAVRCVGQEGVRQ